MKTLKKYCCWFTKKEVNTNIVILKIGIFSLSYAIKGVEIRRVKCLYKDG